MAYIKQIGANILVIGNDAIVDHPELFEQVEGDAPEGLGQLVYVRNVPEQITALQFLMAASFAGIITPEEATQSALPASISAALSGLPQQQQDAAAIRWSRMTVVERTDPMLGMVAQSLGMDAAALDQFFIQAAGL